MKLRYLWAIAALSVATVAYADEPCYMLLTGNDGTVKVLDLDNVDQLTFGDGKMSAHKDGAVTSQFEISSLQTLSFAHEMPAAVGQTLADNGLSFNPASGTIYVDGTKDAVFEIFDANGVRIAAISNPRAGEIDITGLTKGLYVIRYNNATLKIAR